MDDDTCAGMDVIDPEEHTHILVVTRNGFGKRTSIELYNRQSRYGLGVLSLARNDKTIGPGEKSTDACSQRQFDIIRLRGMSQCCCRTWMLDRNSSPCITQGAHF